MKPIVIVGTFIVFMAASSSAFGGEPERLHKRVHPGSIPTTESSDPNAKRPDQAQPGTEDANLGGKEGTRTGDRGPAGDAPSR